MLRENVLRTFQHLVLKIVTWRLAMRRLLHHFNFDAQIASLCLRDFCETWSSGIG